MCIPQPSPTQPNLETQGCSAFRILKFPSCWHESRPEMTTGSRKTNWIVLVEYPMTSTGWFMLVYPHILTLFIHISPYFNNFKYSSRHKTGRCCVLVPLVPCSAVHCRTPRTSTSGAPNSRAHGTTTGFRSIKAPELRHVPGNQDSLGLESEMWQHS